MINLIKALILWMMKMYQACFEPVGEILFELVIPWNSTFAYITF